MDQTKHIKKPSSKSRKEKQPSLTPLQKKMLLGPTMTDSQWEKYLELNPRARQWKI
ncbi:hypothetical protein BH10BAC3_BH10BAC3_06130 [soil metagenome]